MTKIDELEARVARLENDDCIRKIEFLSKDLHNMWRRLDEHLSPASQQHTHVDVLLEHIRQLDKQVAQVTHELAKPDKRL